VCFGGLGEFTFGGPGGGELTCGGSGAAIGAFDADALATTGDGAVVVSVGAVLGAGALMCGGSAGGPSF